jgi:hypothetical protein
MTANGYLNIDAGGGGFRDWENGNRNPGDYGGESTTITPEKMGVILKWFGDQFEESTTKFAPYLDFSNLS